MQKDEKDPSYIGANVPIELRDEVLLLLGRGYTKTEIVKEGIRCCSDKEGLMVRRRETATARPVGEMMHVVAP